jgi:hypothetical protein
LPQLKDTALQQTHDADRFVSRLLLPCSSPVSKVFLRVRLPSHLSFHYNDKKQLPLWPEITLILRFATNYFFKKYHHPAWHLDWRFHTHMLTLKEKLYLLQLLKKQNRKRLFSFGKKDPSHDQLVEKLEQMIRNEQVNREQL